MCIKCVRCTSTAQISTYKNNSEQLKTIDIKKFKGHICTHQRIKKMHEHLNSTYHSCITNDHNFIK